MTEWFFFFLLSSSPSSSALVSFEEGRREGKRKGGKGEGRRREGRQHLLCVCDAEDTSSEIVARRQSYNGASIDAGEGATSPYRQGGKEWWAVRRGKRLNSTFLFINFPLMGGKRSIGDSL